jgi:multiple sugar transport system permease protein
MSSMDRGIISKAEWSSRTGWILHALLVLVMVVAGLLVLFPFMFTVIAGLKTSVEIYDPRQFLPKVANWGNYLEAWTRLNMLTMFKNSFIVAGGAVVGRLFVSALAAYSLSRLKPRGKRVIEAFILITLALPGMAYLIPLYKTLTNLPILHISLLNTYTGLWLPYSASAFTILILKNTFDQIPEELFEAARLDGASEIPLFFRFALPLSSSTLLVLGLLTFITVWGDFLLPLLILRDSSLQTVSVRLFNLVRVFPINLQMAGAFIALLPPTIAALILQRYMKGGLTF